MSDEQLAYLLLVSLARWHDSGGVSAGRSHDSILLEGALNIMPAPMPIPEPLDSTALIIEAARRYRKSAHKHEETAEFSGHRGPITRMRKAMFEDGYIVQLAPGLWLAAWEGDPGRTRVRETAQVYETMEAALAALVMARKYRPFKNATVDTP